MGCLPYMGLTGDLHPKDKRRPGSTLCPALFLASRAAATHGASWTLHVDPRHCGETEIAKSRPTSYLGSALFRA